MYHVKLNTALSPTPEFRHHITIWFMAGEGVGVGNNFTMVIGEYEMK